MSPSTWDISLGTATFGSSCPGSYMKRLLKEKPEAVRNITSLQTSFSRMEVTYMCRIGCRDLSTVATFIESVDAL